MLRRFLAAFRGRSPIGKLILVLLPFAAVGVAAMHGNAEEISAAKTAAPRSKPRPAQASPTPPPTAESPAPSMPSAPTPPSEATRASVQSAATSVVNSGATDATERAALSAAFSGNRSEAAALYDRLATTHNARVFALAARLTREDRVRKP